MCGPLHLTVPFFVVTSARRHPSSLFSVRNRCNWACQPIVVSLSTDTKGSNNLITKSSDTNYSNFSNTGMNYKLDRLIMIDIICVEEKQNIQHSIYSNYQNDITYQNRTAMIRTMLSIVFYRQPERLFQDNTLACSTRTYKLH